MKLGPDTNPGSAGKEYERRDLTSETKNEREISMWSTSMRKRSTGNFPFSLKEQFRH